MVDNHEATKGPFHTLIDFFTLNFTFIYLHIYETQVITPYPLK